MKKKLASVKFTKLQEENIPKQKDKQCVFRWSQKINGGQTELFKVYHLGFLKYQKLKFYNIKLVCFSHTKRCGCATVERTKMRIGLIDVDSHNFPNLALMKISSYHKQLGDSVEMVKMFGEYDKTYRSKVFTFSEEPTIIYTTTEEIKGGSGYDLENKLPIEIESCFPDYSIYPNINYAVGFMTRGCPRKCPFCIVGDKEGEKVYKVSDLSGFWNGQKEIKLLDPNITAYKNRMELFDQLIKSKARIDFTQGLDIRFVGDAEIEKLMQMKLKTIHFAYDRMNQKELIERNLCNFKNRTGFNRSKVSVFILVNYETTVEEDLHRIMFVRSLNFQPYIMVYDKHNIERWKSIYPRLQRWCNMPSVFWKYDDFNQYQKDTYREVYLK